MTIVAGVGASAADVNAAINAKANSAGPFFTGTSTHQIIHATGAVTFDVGLTVAGTHTVGGAGNATLVSTPGATTATAAQISTNGTAGINLNGGTAGVTIVGGGPLVANNGVNMGRGIVVAGALNPYSTWAVSLSGTTTTPTPTIWSWKILSDTLTVPAGGQVSYTDLEGAFGGSTMLGHRGFMNIKMTQTATSGNMASGLFPGGADWGAIEFSIQANATEGGTDTTQAGSYGNLFAGGCVVRTLATATNFHEVTAFEADMNTAAPSYKKFGWKVTQLATDVAQGVLDGAYVIENGGTSANNGWHNGFLAIQPNANFPYATDGWILNAPLASDFLAFNTMAGGINLEPTFTTAAIRSRNFLVDGLGTVRVGNGYLAKTAGGVSLDASGSVGPAEGATLSGAAIVSGGTGYSSTFYLYDPYGGSWVVSSASSGVITLLTCVRTPYFASATPPANPVTLTPTSGVTGTVGGTVTVNIPWTQPNTVAISPAGGPTTVGGSLAVTGTITGPTTTQAVDTNTTALASTAFVLGQVGTATPLINGTAAAGTSKRWTPIDHIHPTDVTRAALTGATFTGAVNVGNSTTQQTLTMNGPAGAQRNTVWSTAGVRRWQLAASGTAELGANAGSDLIIQAFDDTGTLLSTPITVTRSTGTVTFGVLAKLAAFTVASLPAAAGNTGAVAYVTDATAPTYRGALVGGGAVKCTVFCDGTTWTSQ